jgi:hypothetical protein
MLAAVGHFTAASELLFWLVDKKLSDRGQATLSSLDVALRRNP